jgi:hypothetical protein
MSETPRLYANLLHVSIGERDALIAADYVHPEFVGDDMAKGERVAEIVVPRQVLDDLRRDLERLG